MYLIAYLVVGLLLGEIYLRLDKHPGTPLEQSMAWLFMIVFWPVVLILAGVMIIKRSTKR